MLGCRERAVGPRWTQAELIKGTLSTPDTKELREPKLTDKQGGLGRDLEIEPQPSHWSHPHSLTVGPILCLSEPLSSLWSPGLGIIQPGNQAVSLMSAPGRKMDYMLCFFFFLFSVPY